MSDKKIKTTDDIVMELLSKVEAKKKQIGNAERPSWITNCSFGYTYETNSRINIQTVRELEILVEIYAFLINKYESFKNSAVILGLEKEVTFKHMGFTFNQWDSDIRTRIEQLQIKLKKDELAILEERVNKLVSPEQRRQIELDRLVEELK